MKRWHKSFIIATAIIGTPLMLGYLYGTPDRAPDGQQHKRFDLDFTGNQDARQVRQVVQDFVNACPGMRKYTADITHADGSMVEPAYSYESKKRGWENEMRIRIQIDTDPSDIPPSFRMGGHTLTYQLGSGNAPGALTHKEQEQLFCGMVPTGEDALLPIPALAHIDMLKSLSQDSSKPVPGR